MGAIFHLERAEAVRHVHEEVVVNGHGVGGEGILGLSYSTGVEHELVVKAWILLLARRIVKLRDGLALSAAWLPVLWRQLLHQLALGGIQLAAAHGCMFFNGCIG